MRWKISRDCTADPPGELTTMATAPLAMAKARSSGPATLVIDRPGRSGVTAPMTPDRRTTGTTGPLLNRRLRNLLMILRAAGAFGNGWRKQSVRLQVGALASCG